MNITKVYIKNNDDFYGNFILNVTSNFHWKINKIFKYCRRSPHLGSRQII